MHCFCTTVFTPWSLHISSSEFYGRDGHSNVRDLIQKKKKIFLGCEDCAVSICGTEDRRKEVPPTFL
jgi:hypothetical protein